MFYYGFLIKMTKLDSYQYPRAEKTMMLILPDTVFSRAADISFKQFAQLAPGMSRSGCCKSDPCSLRLLLPLTPFLLTPFLLTPLQFHALSKNLLTAALSPGPVGSAVL